MQISVEELVALVKGLSSQQPTTVSIPALSSQGLSPSSLKTPPKTPEDKTPHIIHEMKRILSLDDEALLNEIMPLPSQEDMP
jgi:hypothetical protein